MAKTIQIEGKTYDIESLSAMKDVLESARDMTLSLQQVAKMIEANQRLAKSYADIYKSLKDSNKLYDKQRDAIDEIVVYNREILKNTKADETVRKNINDITNKNRKFLEEIQDITNKIVRNDIDSQEIKKEINKLESNRIKIINEQKVAQKSLKNGFKELSEYLRNKNNFTTSISSDLSNDLEKSTNRYYKLIDSLENARTQSRKTKLQAELKNEALIRSNILQEIFSKSTDKELATEKVSSIFQSSTTLSSLKIQEKLVEDTTTQYQKQFENVSNIEKRIESISRIFKSLKYTPLSSIFDFDKAQSSLKDRVGGLKEGVGKSIAGSLLENSSIAQLGAIGGTVYALKEIIQLMAKADTRVTNLAKSFGVAKNETGGIYQNFENINTEGGKLGVNIDDLINAQLKFNEEFGYSVMLSGNMLKNMVQNTKLIGLSGESTNKLISNALFLNKESSQVENEILGTIVSQSKGLANNKVVLDKVLNTSSEIKANFKGNYAEIAKSVIKAQEFGTTLEQINHIGESLLDFESSITSELNAELLTGKQLNLERARYASLMGDTATLMNEIASQVGTFDDFVNMNVIQQQAYASAVGITRKEMIDMLYQQKINAKLISLGNVKFTEEQRGFLSQSGKFKSEYEKIMKDGLLSQEQKITALGELAQKNLSQLDAQTKFEETLIKIKDKIAQIFGDGAILDKLANGFVSFASSVGIISQEDEKKYLATSIIGQSNPNLKPGSEQYKSLTSSLMKYSPETLKNKSELNLVSSQYGLNSPEYRKKLNELTESQTNLNINSPNYGQNPYREMLVKLDELIKVSANQNIKPINLQLDSMPIKVSQKKTDYNN